MNKILIKEYKRLKKLGVHDLEIYQSLKKIDDNLTYIKFAIYIRDKT